MHNGFASWPVQEHWPASECRFGIHAGGIETRFVCRLELLCENVVLFELMLLFVIALVLRSLTDTPIKHPFAS